MVPTLNALAANTRWDWEFRCAENERCRQLPFVRLNVTNSAYNIPYSKANKYTMVGKVSERVLLREGKLIECSIHCGSI